MEAVDTSAPNQSPVQECRQIAIKLLEDGGPDEGSGANSSLPEDDCAVFGRLQVEMVMTIARTGGGMPNPASRICL